MTEPSPSEPFVPVGFEPPAGLDTPDFVLRPLGPEHNASDLAAWSSSIEHIHATPGWESSDWPHEMTFEENRGDLERHAADFVTRAGFTYTVLLPGTDEVIGCVYIYPAKEGGGASVKSWVRAKSADLDLPLYVAVSSWLERAWPFARFDYAPR